MQYVRVLDQILKNIKESLAIQDQLLEINLLNHWQVILKLYNACFFILHDTN